MDDPAELESALFRNTVYYLQMLTSQVPNSQIVARSFYSTKYRIAEQRGNVCLYTKSVASKVQCRRCCLKFSPNSTNYHIKPELIKRTKFVRKIMNKNKANKVLTRYQEKFIKRNEFVGNYMAITCKFCKNTANIPMAKPKKPVKKVQLTKKRNKNKKSNCSVELPKTPLNTVSKKKTRKMLNKQKQKFSNILNNVVNAKKTTKNKLKDFLNAFK